MNTEGMIRSASLAREALFAYALADGDVKFDLCFVALSMHNAARVERAGEVSIGSADESSGELC